MPSVIDKYLSKLVSRKLAAWAVATGLCYLGHIDADAWTVITMVYIGSQAAQDFALSWKHGRR